MEEEGGAGWGVPRGTGCEGEEESGGRQTAFTLGHTLGSAVLGSTVLATRVPPPLAGSWPLCCACRPLCCVNIGRAPPVCRCPGPQHPKLHLLPTSPWSFRSRMWAGRLVGIASRVDKQQRFWEASLDIPALGDPRDKE